jgi:hypothetical protein
VSEFINGGFELGSEDEDEFDTRKGLDCNFGFLVRVNMEIQLSSVCSSPSKKKT